MIRALTLILCLSAAPLRADVPRVVTDIAPVGAIVARIMQGVGAPDVLLQQNSSPHGGALRPSQARRLAQAELVVWVGPSLTRWLEGPVSSLAGSAEIMTLLSVPGTHLLPLREGGGFEPHAHEDEGHEGHDDHDDHADHKDGDDHDGHEDHQDHGDHAAHEGALDPHAWLDPENGVVWATALAEKLGQMDPVNTPTYQQNLKAFIIEIREMEGKVNVTLQQKRHANFVVLHDAFQYFEERFSLHAAGSVYGGDGSAPGPARLAKIESVLSDQNVRCILVEPQTSAKILDSFASIEGIKTGALPTLGNPDVPLTSQYVEMFYSTAKSMVECLD